MESTKKFMKEIKISDKIMQGIEDYKKSRKTGKKGPNGSSTQRGPTRSNTSGSLFGAVSGLFGGTTQN